MNDKTVLETMDKTVLEERLPLKENADKTVRGWLTVWSGLLKGRDYPLCAGRNFVGSAEQCQVWLQDIHIPDFAFNIRIREGKWLIIDLDSDTGVTVNNELVFRRELNDEDWIKTGNILLRIKKR